LIFDQSLAHASHGDSALNAFSINKGNSGKQPFQKDTIFPPECTFLELQGQKQELWKLNKEGVKEPKGLQAVLLEHGCLIPINAKCKIRCPDPILYPVPISDKPTCCLARLLLTHYDFYHEKSAIATLIKDRGHKCIFLPKFHCELNPIKMY
jgi:hypothetical protein